MTPLESVNSGFLTNMIERGALRSGLTGLFKGRAGLPKPGGSSGHEHNRSEASKRTLGFSYRCFHAGFFRLGLLSGVAWCPIDEVRSAMGKDVCLLIILEVVRAGMMLMLGCLSPLEN